MKLLSHKLIKTWILLLGYAPFYTFLNVQAAGINMEFQNGTKIAPNDQIYILAIGKTQDTKEACFVKFTNNIGTCIKPTSSTKSTDFSIPFPATGTVVTMPAIASGRIYVSLGHAVEMVVKNDGGKLNIIEPDGFKLKDANYYVLYDKFEYSLDNVGLFVNPTAVDFFSLPIGLQLVTKNTVAKFTHSGLTSPRKSVVDTVRTAFSQDKNYSVDWSKLALTYPTKDNVLRLISPGKAMYEASNPAHYFPNTFLQNPAYNYIDELWKYYSEEKPNFLLVELSEGNIVKGQSVGDQFKFSNGDVIQKPTSSMPFFAGDLDPTATNGTTKAIIVREMTSAFDVGILPAPGTTLLKFKDKLGNKISCEDMRALNKDAACAGKDAFDYYQSNPTWGGSGPWFDLYSKALHSFGSAQPIYTFAYDDALAQDGTISISAADVPESKLIVTLGDMTGTTIPVFDNGTEVYNNVSFEIGAKNIVKFTDAEGQPVKLTANAQANVKSPFQVQFCDAQGQAQTTSIYFMPPMVRPFVEGSDGIILNVADRKITFPGLNVECNNP